jgi:subtilisin family serine protease
MYLFSKHNQRIELVPLETEIVKDTTTRRLLVGVEAGRRAATPLNATALVSRASRAFFDIGRDIAGKATDEGFSTPPIGPPPVVFREKETGLLHVVYREITVRFKPGTPEKMQEKILKDGGFKIRQRNDFFSDQVIAYDPARKHSGEQLLEVANRWAEMDETVFAAPNFVSQFRREAPPSVRAEEWHLENRGGGAVAGEDVKILQAWKKTTGNTSIVVAVLDDGVDIEHPNLRTRIWKNSDSAAPDKNGVDFFLPEGHPDRFNPRPKLFRFPFDSLFGNDIHGTPCAGVIAAIGRKFGNINGSVGAAPRCRILPIKIFHADEFAPVAAVANAIRYAARHAQILSCSWTGGLHPDVEQALEDVGQFGRGGLGTPIFCAAGNDDGAPVGFPARDPNAIAVGASTDQAKRASYSNVGPQLAFVAPSDGGTRGIFTTDVSYKNRGFNTGNAAAGGTDGLHTNSFGGTSSATPLAAGVAALVLSIRPNLNRDALRDLLAQTADKIGGGYDSSGHSNEYGYGRINAARAIQAALALP